ncbi:MAG: hypothetical protein JSR77_01435 [Planctomycetes bacterium]|nr:hypothetical protein [Planctomycetota bacterium]
MKHSLTSGILLVLLVPLVASLGACASGGGRCVGAPGTAASANVLLNLDKDGVAIDGYDPVAYFTDAKAVKGDSSIRTIWGGAVYYFASAEHKAAFDASPEKYAPQFGGYCAYAASIDTISPVDPNFWEIVDGRLLLQHNQRAWDEWHKQPRENLVKADRNWPGLVRREGAPARALLNVDAAGLAIQGFDPVAYFTDGKPVKGDPALTRTFQGATFAFADTDHKNLFEKDPGKYVPQFGGFCGYAASINKVSQVDPQIWQIVNGRLVLQHTPEAYRLFNQDPQGNYAKAVKNWPGLSHRRCE